MLKLFYCKCCKKAKEDMEMHSIEEELCKICWSKDDKRFQNTKGLHRKGHHKNKL